MSIVMIVGVSMSILAAIFWCAESLPFVRKVRSLKQPKHSKNPLVTVTASLAYVTNFIGAVMLLWPLAIDILVTVWLTASFGFGGTLIGGVLGLTISNVISIYLLYISRRKE